MPVTHDCLDDDTLLAFAARELPEARGREVEEAIDVCEDCRALLALLLEALPASPASGGSSVTLDTVAAPSLDPGVFAEAPRIAERFVLERRAGQGAMGEVYRARDQENGAAVAIKLMMRAASDPARVAREVRLLSELAHPRIARYIAHGRADDGRTYLVMEWIEGVTLADRLEAGRLTVDETISLGLQLTSALEAVHERGVVHRDIKPRNLMLSGGRIDGLVVVDFGIAHEPTADSRLTRTGAVLGTPGYMAPEQARGQTDIGRSADIFAVGAVLYHALTGHPPFTGGDMLQILIKTVVDDPPRPGSARDDVPAELDHLIMGMLEKRAAARPPDARSAGRALESAKVSIANGALSSNRDIGALERRLFSVIRIHEAARALPATSELSDLAARYGGTLEGMLDGSLVVAYRSSGVAADDAANAARCALAFHAALPNASIAVATGRDRAGHGDAGSMLERLTLLAALPERIEVDDVTAGFLDARFELTSEHGAFLLHRESDVGEEQRVLLGKRSPFVGRDRELASVLAIVEESFDEPVARKVLVTGEPGLGKSRLRREIVDRLARLPRGTEVWTGRGDTLRAGAPFSLLAAAFLRSAGVSPGDPPNLAKQRIELRVARNLERSGRAEAPRALEIPGLEERDRVSAFIGESVGFPFSEEGAPALAASRRDATLMADQIRRAWCDFLVAECSAHPLALVLEDVQWGDRASLQLLVSCWQALAHLPFTILAFGRPEARDMFPDLTTKHDGEELVLRPLGRRASEELVRFMLGGATQQATIERLVELAQGNAYFLEELIRSAAQGRSEAPPETIVAMTEALLERLDPKTRRVLRAASIFGGEFRPTALSSVLGQSSTSTEVERAVHVLSDREMIVLERAAHATGDKTYRFRHALLREAAYATLTDEDRRQGHARAGAWLEAHGGEEAAALGEHFLRGGDPVRAADHFLTASRRALAADDARSARELAEKGVECASAGDERACRTRGESKTALSTALRLLGDLVGSEREGMDAALLLERGSGPWFEAQSLVAHAAGRQGHDDVLARTRSAIVDTPALPSARGERIKAIHALCTQAWFKGKIDDWQSMVAMIERDTDPDDPGLAARLLQQRGRAASRSGDLGSYVELHQAAIDQALLSGDVRFAQNLRFNLAHGLIELGLADRVVPLMQALLENRSGGTEYLGTGAHLNMGRALLALGDHERALGYLEETIARCKARGDRRSEGGARMYLADGLRELGRLDEAEAEALLAVETLGAASPLLPRARVSLARVMLKRARYDEARTVAAVAASELESLRFVEEGSLLTILTLAEALRGCAEAEAARPLLVEAKRSLDERASRIVNPAYRASFLERVPEHARIDSLCRELGIDPDRSGYPGDQPAPTG